MTEPTSVRLDVSRVGPQMIYKVTALDAAGNELDHVGWIVAQVANENPLAMEEAHEVASQWCLRYSFKTYTMHDHRVHPNDYIANAASRLDPRTAEHSTQFQVRDRPAVTPMIVANDNASTNWETHCQIFGSLPGADDVLDWYGEVPAFHDASLVGIDLKPGTASAVAIEFWRLLPAEGRPRVLEPIDERIVAFVCDEVVDLELSSCGPSTTLNSLRLRPGLLRDGRPKFSLAAYESSDVELHLEPHCGISGWLRCRGLRLELRPTGAKV